MHSSSECHRGVKKQDFLKKVGVDATQAIVVENAPLGVQSAVAAGIFTIAVNTGPLPDEILKEAGADIVVKDMAAALREIKRLKN